MVRSSHILELAVVALLGLAVLMVNSAGSAVGGAGHTGDAGLVAGAAKVLTSRAVIYAVLAVAVMLLASRINVRQLFAVRGWTNPLSLIVAGALALAALTLVPGMGKSVNGASRWLYLGPRSWGLSFQPSELVKWVMVLAIAWWCARRRGLMHRFRYGLVPPMMLLGIACFIVVVEDLGTAALIGLVAVCMLIAGGARLKHMAFVVPIGLIGLVAALFHSPYRLDRLTAFLDPWADPAGSGYHPIQSMLAVSQGGLTGRGLGNGIQKFGYLPEDTTDFIFAVICEELGIMGAMLVVALFMVILWIGLGIVRDCKDTFGRLVGLGVLLTVGLQAAINIAVVVAVVPTKGIALPLVSSGGTGWIMTAFALGLVAALDNANYLEAEEELEGLVLEPV